MKKIVTLTVALILFAISCIVLMNIRATKVFENELKKQAQEYLFEKYSKHPIINDKVGYYDSVYFFHNVCFENENIQFQLRYIDTASLFEDDYLEENLREELKQILYDEFNKAGLYNCEIFVSNMIGPPSQLSKRLYLYYTELGKVPTINDIITTESFDYININSETLDENRIQDIINNMNLPVHRVRYNDK